MTAMHVESAKAVDEAGVDSYRDHPRELMEALITVGALVAVADNRTRAVKSEALVNYIDRRHLFPTVSRSEIERCLADRTHELQDRKAFELIMKAFQRLSGFFSGSMVIRFAERVAIADGEIRPSELSALNLIRLMMTNSPAKAIKMKSPRLLLPAL